MKIAMPHPTPRLVSKTINTGKKLKTGFESAVHTFSNLHVSLLDEFSL